MTTPPTITAASTITVWICTGMRPTSLGEERAGNRDRADQEGKGHDLRGDDAGQAADDGSEQRHAANQHEFAERNVGEAGQNIHSR